MNRTDRRSFILRAVATSNCKLFQGTAADGWGGCPLFGGKLVSAKGWCSAWAKKA